MQDGYTAHPGAVDACTHFGALYDTDTVARGGLSEIARIPVALTALVAESAPQVDASVFSDLHSLMRCSTLERQCAAGMQQMRRAKVFT